MHRFCTVCESLLWIKSRHRFTCVWRQICGTVSQSDDCDLFSISSAKWIRKGSTWCLTALGGWLLEDDKRKNLQNQQEEASKEPLKTLMHLDSGALVGYTSSAFAEQTEVWSAISLAAYLRTKVVKTWKVALKLSLGLESIIWSPGVVMDYTSGKSLRCLGPAMRENQTWIELSKGSVV